jgi:hypothetical protein
MDIERFHILTEIQKLYYAKTRGVRLCTIQDEKALIHLYAVGNYYLESIFLFTNSEDYYSRAFTSVVKLEPFLQAINIDCLFQ